MNTPNRDVLMGKWKQFRGRVREEWGKLTDNQIDQINGDYDRLIGVRTRTGNGAAADPAWIFLPRRERSGSRACSTPAAQRSCN